MCTFLLGIDGITNYLLTLLYGHIPLKSSPSSKVLEHVFLTVIKSYEKKCNGHWPSKRLFILTIYPHYLLNGHFSFQWFLFSLILIHFFYWVTHTESIDKKLVRKGDLFHLPKRVQSCKNGKKKYRKSSSLILTSRFPSHSNLERIHQIERHRSSGEAECWENILVLLKR